MGQTTSAVPALAEAEVQAILAAAIERYLDQRHARVAGFVDANFSLLGSLRLHRRAFGLDLVRAPANVALIIPYLGLQLGAAGLRRLGARKTALRLRRQKLFFDTSVARELTFRLHADLLELPYQDGARRTERDAVAEAVLADPRVAAAMHSLETLVRDQRGDPEAAARLRAALATYAGTRNAAADLVNNLLMAGAGGALFQKLTPGTLTLGPVIATTLAHQAAVASFPLGASLGGIWYGWFPVAPTTGLIAGTTGGLMLAAASLTAFAGVIADPIQRATGWHHRRLAKLIDALGREFQGDSEAAFHARDHYVARIFDLIDLARAAYRGL